jgi:hypothetical protein
MVGCVGFFSSVCALVSVTLFRFDATHESIDEELNDPAVSALTVRLQKFSNVDQS